MDDADTPLGERPTLLHVLGLLLVAAAVALAVRSLDRPREANEPPVILPFSG